MPNNGARSQELLVTWLRDAHAMEKQAEQMLKAMSSRIENYPEVRDRIVQHLEETRRQAERVERCLQRHDGDSSTVKDVAGQMAAMGQALGGMFASDEIIKGSMASFAFEAMEIAAYKALITAAEHCGDQETKRACETNLREEEEMERWLGENLPLVTERYLSLSESGATAKS